MSISSINASIASAAQQSPQVPIINSIKNSNNVVTTINNPTGSTITISTTPGTTALIPPVTTTVNPKSIKNDWLKIKVNSLSSNDNQAFGKLVALSPQTENNNYTNNFIEDLNIKSITTSSNKNSTPNFVKHKLVSTSSSSPNSSSVIHLSKPTNRLSTSVPPVIPFVTPSQATTTLTLSSTPININLKSTNPISPAPNTTSLNLTQFTKNNSASSTSNNNTGTLNIFPTTLNVNNRKINMGLSSTQNTKITLQSTTPNTNSSTSSTSNTINNLVKNILSASTPNNTAAANAAVAVTAAASIFNQMNSETMNSNNHLQNSVNNNMISHNGSKIISRQGNASINAVTPQQHPIITTLMSSNTNTNSYNSECPINDGQQTLQHITKFQSTNQINLPPSTLNLNQSQGQLPKITVLNSLGNSSSTNVLNHHHHQSAKSSIIQAQVRTSTSSNDNAVTTPPGGSTITKTTVPISLKQTISTQSSGPLSSQPQPLQQHLIPLNPSSNGQISNIVSGINLKSLSPISFATSPSDGSTNMPNLSFVNSKISNIANVSRCLQNSTTPPPITITNNNQPLTISTANISNYISKQGSVNSKSDDNNFTSVSNNASNLATLQHTLTNNYTNSNSQTIAQLYSGLNSPFQLQNTGNPTATLQSIRLIPNNPNLHQNYSNQISQNQINSGPRIQNNNNIQNNVQLQQITLNSSILNNNPNNGTNLMKKNNSNNRLENSSSSSNIPQSSSSPSASPLKPNIIRKTARRDSPSHHANLNNPNSIESQHSSSSPYNQSSSSSSKHPIYELTQNAMILDNNQNSPSKKVNSSNSMDLTNSQGQRSDFCNPLPTSAQGNGQTQIFSLPSSSATSSSSFNSNHNNVTSSNSKSILNLIAESSSNDTTKSIRKFTLNTQLNIPSNIAQVSASTSSMASSSSSANQNVSNISHNNHMNNKLLNDSKNSTFQIDMQNSSNFNQNYSNNSPIIDNKNNSQSTPTSRKRRKQEFKKIPEEHLISYNSNPLSDNTALAYSVNTNLSPNTNRYLNENTNISNNNHNKQGLHGSFSNVILKTQNTNQRGYYFNKNESDIKIEDIMSNVVCEDENISARSNKKMRTNLQDNSNQVSNLIANDNRKNNGDLQGQDVQILKNDEDDYSSDSCLDDEAVRILSKEFSYVASNGVKWATKRNRANIAITKCYKTTWKPRNNHYQKYSDIKEKEKKKTSPNPAKTVTHNEVLKNLNEWKFHFVISQVKNLISFENDSLNVIEDIENLMQNKKFFDGYSDISVKINESIKANTQRHKYVNEQLDEAQQLIHKLFDHKEKFKNYLLYDTTCSSSSTTSKSNQNLEKYTSRSNQNHRNTDTPNKTKNFSGTKKGISTRSSQLKSSNTTVGNRGLCYGSPGKS